MSTPVPYKAYQSKRHSRTLSPTFTPPQSPPLVPVGSPSKIVNVQTSNEHSKRLSAPIPILPDISPAEPNVAANAITAPAPSATPIVLTPQPIIANGPISIIEVPPSPISEPATAPTSPKVVEESSNAYAKPENGKDVAESSSNPLPSVPSPTIAKLAENPTKEPIIVPRPRHLSTNSSTFRHIPARGSPLRPSVVGARSPYGSVLASPLALGPQPRPNSATYQGRPRPLSVGSLGGKVSDFTSTTNNSPVQSPSISGSPVSALPTTAGSRPVASSPLSSSTTPWSLKQQQPLPQPTSVVISAPIPPPKSSIASPSVSPSRPATSPAPSPVAGASASSSNRLAHGRSTTSAPYRHGFQPKGVYRPRTDEFLDFRTAKRDVARIEDRRLERRLEKLIDLHFLSPTSKSRTPQSPNGPPDPSKPPPNRRQSSIFDFDLSDLKGKNASDLWRGVLETSSRVAAGSKGDIRQQEQAITPWQDDATAPACPICLTAFNTLTNRKHHCRLCGKVVCSLPVKLPTRPELCSFLFVVDSVTGEIEEVGGEIIDYGVKRRETNGQIAKKLAEEQEKYLKGVRICKECKPALRRRQYAVESKTVTTFARLYETLLALEREIEGTLPEFQELVIRLSQEDNTPPSTPIGVPSANSNVIKQASNLRKQLLEAFSQYDAVSRRIKGLETKGPGSSQDRVQNAITNRATLFLQRNMVPLQSLPKPRKPNHSHSSSINSLNTLSLPEMAGVDQDAALAHTLQPLLEQEALLESFVEEANAQRKFEDAKTLKANLKEIRSEIDRLLSGRDLGGGDGKGPSVNTKGKNVVGKV